MRQQLDTSFDTFIGTTILGGEGRVATPVLGNGAFACPRGLRLAYVRSDNTIAGGSQNRAETPEQRESRAWWGIIEGEDEAAAARLEAERAELSISVRQRADNQHYSRVHTLPNHPEPPPRYSVNDPHGPRAERPAIENAIPTSTSEAIGALSSALSDRELVNLARSLSRQPHPSPWNWAVMPGPSLPASLAERLAAERLEQLEAQFEPIPAVEQATVVQPAAVEPATAVEPTSAEIEDVCNSLASLRVSPLRVSSPQISPTGTEATILSAEAESEEDNERERGAATVPHALETEQREAAEGQERVREFPRTSAAGRYRSSLNSCARPFSFQSSPGLGASLGFSLTPIEVRELTSTREVPKVRITLENVRPAERSKATAAVAAVLGFQPGKVSIEASPIIKNRWGGSRTGTTNTLLLSIPVPVDWDTALVGQNITNLNDFKIFTATRESSWISFIRTTRLGLGPELSGLNYHSELRHPEPDRVFLTRPHTSTRPLVAHFDAGQNIIDFLGARLQFISNPNT